MNVIIEIEELVLHGFPAGQRYAIAEAVERELARLVGERGVPPGLAVAQDAAWVDGGAFDAAPGARPQQIGVQVARAVYGGLTR